MKMCQNKLICKDVEDIIYRYIHQLETADKYKNVLKKIDNFKYYCFMDTWDQTYILIYKNKWVNTNTNKIVFCAYCGRYIYPPSYENLNLYIYCTCRI